MTLSVKTRVEVALDTLRLIGAPWTPHPTQDKNRFAGLRDTMAGAKGRVVSFWTGFTETVEIHGVFALSTGAGAQRYTLEFSLTVREGATALDIMRAATKIAELHEDLPKFEPHELQQVYAGLEDLLGPIKAAV